MMPPEVAAVVEAARHVADSYRGYDGNGPAMAALITAVEALKMREDRPAGPTYEEQDRTWGEVVAGDEVLSEKTRKWYEVTTTALDDATGKVKIRIKGAPKPIIRTPTEPVKLKRGIHGDAADLFAILFSG